jgi:hypothetical protein
LSSHFDIATWDVNNTSITVYTSQGHSFVLLLYISKINSWGREGKRGRKGWREGGREGGREEDPPNSPDFCITQACQQ